MENCATRKINVCEDRLDANSDLVKLINGFELGITRIIGRICFGQKEKIIKKKKKMEYGARKIHAVRLAIIRQRQSSGARRVDRPE